MGNVVKRPVKAGAEAGKAFGEEEAVFFTFVDHVLVYFGGGEGWIVGEEVVEGASDEGE